MGDEEDDQVVGIFNITATAFTSLPEAFHEAPGYYYRLPNLR